MNPIGGYFELELPTRTEYHKKAIHLNTGRNAFEYILRAKGFKKVHLPYYTCNVMLEPIHKLNLEYEFYHIDKNFWPLINFSTLKRESVFVYTNYFGMFNDHIKDLSNICKNLIIDNSQAFFSEPIQAIDTFYSPRKFFGVPDGAYLYTDVLIENKLDIDISFQRFKHLLGRIDLGAEQFFTSFKNSDLLLAGQPIKTMSILTQRILESIDYHAISIKRQNNFVLLHNALKETNQFKFKTIDKFKPMAYPFLVDNGEELRNNLIENKIFIPTYWPNVIAWTKKNSFEYYLTKNLIAIPVDQRYDINEMKSIVKIIKNYI